ncbi:uncharacterized LOC107803884 [Nicotiana tabacum]|uniref:Centromere protein C homologue n=2 Tax=Nicotiana TaxID=4085 RepID=D0FY44_TOBAC|nr:uncharacterized protein LOC104228251 [Nicotiana sylvestris]NP_001312672.1 uncharacterized LOC107803884 [Nicotiana tabacum]BAI48081.1 centromere protein C homologue [Nicotiana tabacum]BAI48086.1 centromere protein C [Nicotiana sylvestris]
MANEAPTSGPVDPLHGLVGLSLFPKTIRVCTDVSVDPKNLESVHNFMKSLETKSSAKLFEEARAIVDNAAELLNTKCMGVDGDLAMKGKEQPKERRPGLGRRKPRFSFKPSTSQPPPVILGSTLESLDMDQLEDPVDFFAAAERWEEAEKELKRLKGISINDDVNDPPANARRRRPGILNKSVRYKHRFSSIQSENDDAFISSQKTLGSDTRACQNSQLPEELPGLNVELQEADSPGSLEKTEINGILNELLSSNGEDLIGEMALSNLQERLGIKPIELGPLCIPEFPMTGKVDGKAFGERIRKPWKFSQDIRDLVKSATEGTASTRRQHEESPTNNLASPTPPKSPHASLSLLKQKIFRSNPLRDPFSPLNIDLYNNDSQSDHPPGWSMKMNPQCISNNAGPTESHGETENIAGSDDTNIMVPLSGSDFSHEQLMENDSGKDNVKTGSNGSQSGEELENGYDIEINTDINLNMRNMDSHYESDALDKVKDVSVVNDVSKDQQGLETESYFSCQKMQDGEVLAETLSSPQAQGEADDTHNCSVETVAADFGSFEIDGQVDDMPPQRANSAEQDHHFEDSVKDVTSDQLSSVAVEVHSTEVRSKLPDMSPQHHAKAKDKQPKAKRPAGGRRESKALRSRPSLADAGTSFQDGVRRSKRMKTRPLEYWKGERLLYGWINDSLKLVGVKYLSPGKGSVKVESYISDDYKDLVESAARY